MMPDSSKCVAYFAENALSPIQGGGIVAYAVLKGIQPENLLGFYDYENITPASEYAHRFILLPRWRWLGSLQMLQERVYDLLNRISPLLTFLAALYFLIFNSIPLVLSYPLLARRDLVKVLAEMDARGFTPELVYFSGLSLRYLTLAVAVSKKFNVPMVVLHMDDWMARECQQLGRFLGTIWYNRIVAQMKEAAARSLASTTNSPGLAKKVTEMTGYVHDAANNCCADLLEGGGMAPLPENNVKVITYAGAMNKNLQGKTLEIFSRAVAELKAEGIKIQLRIYTSWEFAPMANSIRIPGAVEYMGHASRAELAKAYSDSDFLLTTTTFDAEKLTLFKYSLSTKLSEYLCVGRPVISVGHQSWHLHEYVLEHGCGIAITERGLPFIKQQLRGLLARSREELLRTGQSNRELWESAHNVQVMAARTRKAVGIE
jgi:glycosyltransferase involved in cell wall biosynthesis